MLSELAKERKVKEEHISLIPIKMRERGKSESKNYNYSSNKDFEFNVLDHIKQDPDQDFFQ